MDNFRRDTSKFTFKDVQVIEENKKEDVTKKELTDRETFDSIMTKVEEFLLRPAVNDYLIYLETLIQVIILVTAIFCSWLITKMGLSIAYVLVNIWIFSIIYSFIGRILTKKISNKMKLEAQKQDMDTHPESIEWLNFLLQKIWGTIEPVAAEMVPEIVDSVLKDFCPSFLHSIRLTKFCLGSEAPRLESVTCFDNLEQEEMQMIWHCSFMPVTAEENKYDDNKRTTEIQATAFVGKEKFLVPLNINVSNLLFEGKILLRVRFSHSYPFIKTASVCFMEPPKLSCSLKPLVGIDLMSIPGVQEMTDLTIRTVLPEIALNPTTIDLDLETMLKSTSHDDPTGVLKVNLMEGRGLKNVEKIGTSDPYLKMKLGGNEIARTRVMDNDLNPFWNETKYLIIPINVIRDSFIGADKIEFEVYDKNKVSDKLMGKTATLRLSEYAKLLEELEEEALNEANEEEGEKKEGEKKEGEKKEEEKKETAKSPTTPVTKSKKKLTPEERERIISEWGDPRLGEFLQLPLKLGSKEVGNINLQISYHAIKKPGEQPKPQGPKSPEPKSPEAKTEQDENGVAKDAAENQEQVKAEEENEIVDNELRSGILRVHLHSMKDLEKKKGTRSNPYAIVEVNHEILMETQAKKKTNNPVFSLSKDIFIKNINNATLKLTVRDKKDLAADPIIGNLRFKIKPTMKYILENPTNDWLELQNSPKGRVRFSFDWFPVKMYEESENSPAIGICRVDLLNANNLKNVEKLGKSDPYAKLTISGRRIDQTRIIDSNLNPIWNETFYTIVQSRNDRIKFELFDYNNINNDKKLGSVEYFIKDICDNISDEVGQTKDFVKMRVKPTFTKLEDGRYDVVSPLYEKQQNNINCQGEIHFQIQYYPLTAINRKDNKDADAAKAEATEEGAVVEKKEKPKIELGSMSGRGFSIFSASQMGISSSELNDPNKSNVTGILRIKLEEAKNLRAGSQAYTEFAFDNSPDEIFFRSAVIKSSEPVWDEMAEGLIMNIVNNKLLLNIRARSRDSGTSDADISLLSIKFGLNDIAPNLNKSVWYTDDKTNPNAPAIKIAFGYQPIDIVVPPKDYLPNMGILTVNVDDGKVVAMDSSGTSDPYIIFSLNGNKVYTTKEVKKTLAPYWNEKFDINLRSRRSAELELELMDWNKVEKHVLIGTGILSLVGLVPNQNLVVPVDIISKENKKVGVVNLVLNFSPKCISKSKQDKEASSQSAPTKVINNVAQGGFSVVKGVFKAPSSVVSGVASGFSKTFKGSKNKGAELKDESPASVTSNKQQQQILSDPSMSEISDLPRVSEIKGLKQEPSVKSFKTEKSINEISEATEQINVNDVISITDKVSVGSGNYAESDVEGNRSRTFSVSDIYGTLHIHVLEAKELLAVDSSGTSDPYAKIMKDSKVIGKTKVVKKNVNPVWNESYKINLGEVINHNITIILKDHNTMQSSKALGEVQIDTHNNFNVSENNTSDEWYPVNNGSGSIHVKLEYIADEIDSKKKKKGSK